jgi:hypothetical protein
MLVKWKTAKHLGDPARRHGIFSAIVSVRQKISEKKAASQFEARRGASPIAGQISGHFLSNFLKAAFLFMLIKI